MKQKLLYLLPLFLLSGCGQVTYKNASLPAEERAGLLLKELTLEEKVSLMMDSSKPVERLGIKPITGGMKRCMEWRVPGRPQCFPNRLVWRHPSRRRLYTRYLLLFLMRPVPRMPTIHPRKAMKRYQGLTMWTPTVNIYRDPRWGRGIETYGEDPYLTSRMGVMVVKGLQGTNDGKYDKLHACAKHFAVHSGSGVEPA